MMRRTSGLSADATSGTSGGRVTGSSPSWESVTGRPVAMGCSYGGLFVEPGGAGRAERGPVDVAVVGKQRRAVVALVTGQHDAHPAIDSEDARLDGGDIGDLGGGVERLLGGGEPGDGPKAGDGGRQHHELAGRVLFERVRRTDPDV